MSKNIIMRVVWNRSEMLQISIEHEIEARKYHMLSGDFTTLFVIEYGAPSKVFELVEKYPFEKQIIVRESQYGLSKNILEGMKIAFNMTDDYIIYIEDDICIHKTYFKYMDLLLNMDIGKFSVLSAFNHNNNGSVNEVYKGHHYCAWGALISKNFFTKYINTFACTSYYENRASIVLTINEKYKEYFGIEGKNYKFKNSNFNEQAGLINRLVDVAMIEEDLYIIMPKVNRQIHIGFYGKNRPGSLFGDTYDERLTNMKNIIMNNKFYELSQSKQYDDYELFSKKLDAWDGTIKIV